MGIICDQITRIHFTIVGCNWVNSRKEVKERINYFKKKTYANLLFKVFDKYASLWVFSYGISYHPFTRLHFCSLLAGNFTKFVSSIFLVSVWFHYLLIGNLKQFPLILVIRHHWLIIGFLNLLLLRNYARDLAEFSCLWLHQQSLTHWPSQVHTQWSNIQLAIFCITSISVCFTTAQLPKRCYIFYQKVKPFAYLCFVK